MSWSLLSDMIILLALVGVLVTPSAATQCYYPNGARSNDTPCYTDGNTSHCCSSESMCFTSGLCLSFEQPFGLSRESCTDESWGSGCPTLCSSYNVTGPASISWLNGSSVNSHYCCGPIIVKQKEKSCGLYGSFQQLPFLLANSFPISNTAALTGLVSQSECDSIGPINNTNTRNTNNSTSTSASMPTITKTSQCISRDDMRMVAVGAGLGIPLGAIAIASLGWAFWERKRKQNSPRPTPLSIQGDPSSNVEELDGRIVGELDGSLPRPAEMASGESRISSIPDSR